MSKKSTADSAATAVRSFTCDECGDTFPVDDEWASDDALAELCKNFGYVCDDCHKQIMREITN